MIDLNSKSIFFARDSVDFRKGVDGLTRVIQDGLGKNPFDNSLFIFCCKKRDRVKIIYWDRTGFALWYKRLEKGRFIWPKKFEGDTLSISSEQLSWLLSGIDIEKLRPHEELFFDCAI